MALWWIGGLIISTAVLVTISFSETTAFESLICPEGFLNCSEGLIYICKLEAEEPVPPEDEQFRVFNEIMTSCNLLQECNVTADHCINVTYYCSSKYKTSVNLPSLSDVPSRQEISNVNALQRGYDVSRGQLPLNPNCRLITEGDDKENFYVLFAMFDFGSYLKISDGSRYCLRVQGKDSGKFCTGSGEPKNPSRGHETIRFRFEEDQWVIDMNFHWENNKGEEIQDLSLRGSHAMGFRMTLEVFNKSDRIATGKRWLECQSPVMDQTTEVLTTSDTSDTSMMRLTPKRILLSREVVIGGGVFILVILFTVPVSVGLCIRALSQKKEASSVSTGENVINEETDAYYEQVGEFVPKVPTSKRPSLASLDMIDEDDACRHLDEPCLDRDEWHPESYEPKFCEMHGRIIEDHETQFEGACAMPFDERAILQETAILPMMHSTPENGYYFSMDKNAQCDHSGYHDMSGQWKESKQLNKVDYMDMDGVRNYCVPLSPRQPSSFGQGCCTPTQYTQLYMKMDSA